ncbi:MAG: iron uptake transporter permease EfeU [Actinomycetota bacterium]|nr:FTR1 family protein [Actinomycetota bacterium]
MGSAFLIMLREGLEMALIVAIVLAYLRQIGRRKEFRTVWAGTGAAIGISIVAGIIVFAAVGDLEGRGEQIVEGVTAFLAAGLLTWMVFWMRQQARLIKSELHSKVDAALATGSAVAIAGVAFFAVLREGLETVLFLLGSSVGHERALDRAIGGVAGVAVAAFVGYVIYSGSRRVNLRSFFKVTGFFVLIFAAGLFAKGIHEFQEAALLGSLKEHLWTISSSLLDPDRSRLGEFLEGLFGWHPQPSIEMVVAYFAYLLPIGYVFYQGTRGVPPIKPEASTIPATASAAT